MVATPIVYENYVFASSAYGTGSALIRVVPDVGGLKAEKVYFLEAKVMQNHYGGMVLVGDHIYCGHGHNNGFPLCVKIQTGAIAWRPGRGPGTGSAAVVYAHGHLHFRYESGLMALTEAPPEKYVLKGIFQIDSSLGKSSSHPGIGSAAVFI